MRRFLRLTLTTALVATLTAPATALSLSETITDWLCAGAQEREVAARVLTLVAGQGRGNLEESFFAHCIDDVAYVALLQAKTIREVANGCTLTVMLTHAEAD